MTSIKILEAQKRKLLKLQKKAKAIEKVEKQKIMLKQEIAKLKRETSKSVVAKLRRLAKSPETKEKAQQAKRAGKIIRKKFQSFRKFADKLSDDI